MKKKNIFKILFVGITFLLVGCPEESTNSLKEVDIFFKTPINTIIKDTAHFSPTIQMNNNRLYLIDQQNQVIIEYSLFGEFLQLLIPKGTQHNLTSLIHDSILNEAKVKELEIHSFFEVTMDKTYFYFAENKDSIQLTRLSLDGKLSSTQKDIFHFGPSDFIKKIIPSDNESYLVVVQRTNQQDFFWFRNDTKLLYQGMIPSDFAPEKSPYKHSDTHFIWEILTIDQEKQKIILQASILFPTDESEDPADFNDAVVLYSLSLKDNSLNLETTLYDPSLASTKDLEGIQYLNSDSENNLFFYNNDIGFNNISIIQRKRTGELIQFPILLEKINPSLYQYLEFSRTEQFIQFYFNKNDHSIYQMNLTYDTFAFLRWELPD